ncbi:MAG: hypothetical protein A2W08_02535 [Candidatus Rokubacteria bacterium RBG_16_73_20]|nr:MAG: hypothetical protein A2X52_10910 [Candidatus Rokubacteria bacterium GWC2_70_16]OGK97496.1 MAG: hypothetical protein A2W08_02535 [Candidatus Rokubacteria bacterium RBG_16_73_20]HBH04234.1 hypothetical protein [Candidatus Rokubacteria bacterium]
MDWLPLATTDTAPARSRLTERPRRECRCECGSLLARLSAIGIELKCRRCKRVVILPLPVPPGGRRSPP